MSVLPAPVNSALNAPVDLPNTGTTTSESSPAVAYDPVNTDDRVAFWTTSGGASQNGQSVILQGAFSINGGLSWTSLGVPLNLTTIASTTQNPIRYDWAVEPSVSFDRSGNFYLVYTERTQSASEGAVVLQRYSFPAAGTPTQALTNKVVGRWANSTDALYNATVAADATVTSFTDPDSGDTVTNANPGQIYVAWTLSATPPTGAGGTYATDGIQMAISSDQGATFGAASYVSDNPGSPIDGVGSNYVRPQIVVSQGTGAQNLNASVTTPITAGQVTIVFSRVAPNGVTDGNAGAIDVDHFSGLTASSATGTTGTITDAIKAVSPATIDTPSTSTFTANVALSGASKVKDIELDLAIAHDSLAQLNVTLISPLGVRVPVISAGQLTGGNLGFSNGKFIGTVFDAEAVRGLSDVGAVTPFIGHFSIGLGAYYGFGTNEANGQWKLEVVDGTNGGNGTVNAVGAWSLHMTLGADPAAPQGSVGGTDVVAAISNVTNSKTGSFPLASPAAPARTYGGGIGTGVTIASDNTLGSFSPNQGNLYITFVGDDSLTSPTAKPDTDIFLMVSHDGGATWSQAATVNDDAGNDTLPQFQPVVAVDQITGTVAISWLDTRDDSNGLRTAPYVGVSIDGGTSFGKQTYASLAGGVFDVNSQSTKVYGPRSDNQSSGAVTPDAFAGIGGNIALFAVGGKVSPVWASNLNGGPSGTRRSTISVGQLQYAAGPRVVSGTSGVVGDALNPSTATGPELGQIQIQFDRPVDPSTLTVSSVVVLYRPPNASGNDPGTSVAIGSVLPANGANTLFTVTLAAQQTAVGTYSYYVKPTASDRVRHIASDGTTIVSGNLMDQNSDGQGGTNATTGGTRTNGDVFAMPSPTGPTFTSAPSAPSYFATPYDPLTLPLIVPGPHVVATGISQATIAADNANLYFDAAAKALYVRFDRPMDPSTFTTASIRSITGPLGDIPITSAVTITPDPFNTEGANVKTFKITLPDQTLGSATYTGQALSGQYSLQLNETIKSAAGDAMDVSQTGGLAELIATSNSTGITNSYSVPNPVASLTSSSNQGDTVDLTLDVPDSYVATRIQVGLSIATSDTRRISAELIAPDGTTTAFLFGGSGVRVGTNGAHVNFTGTVFNDDGTSTPVSNGGAPFFGPFLPQQSLLTAFQTTNVQGRWTLRITALDAGADAVVTAFSLKLNHAVTGTGIGTSADRTLVPFKVFNLDPTSPLSSSNWTAVGPASANGNSGQINAIAVDPSDPSGNTVYAAGATGGVWKTRDFLTSSANGPTWAPLTDLGPNNSLAVSSIVLVPQNNDPDQTIVYVTTGDLDGDRAGDAQTITSGSTSHVGVGMLRSMDAGRTWQFLDSLDNKQYQSDGTTVAGGTSPLTDSHRSHEFLGSFITKLVVDPVRSPAGELIMYAGVITGSASTSGVYRSLDSGLTWSPMKIGLVTDISLDTTSATVNALGQPVGNVDIIYASFASSMTLTYSSTVTNTLAGTAGVLQSPNRGVLWNTLAGGQGDPLIRDDGGNALTVSGNTTISAAIAGAGRIQLARPDTSSMGINTARLYEGWLWALVTNADGGFNGLYLTKDFGQNWVKVNALDGGGNTLASAIGGGGLSSSAITADPNNPNVVYVGGSGGSQLMRIDATFLADSYAYFVRNWGDNTGGPTNVISYTNPPQQQADPASYLKIPTDALVPHGSPLTDPAINLLRDPVNTFNANATLISWNANNAVANGTGATWTDVSSMLTDNGGTANVHAIAVFKDTLTGQTRLYAGNDNVIATGVDAGDVGEELPAGVTASNGYLRSLGGTTIAFGDRVGNLQVGQAVAGAAQPDLAAGADFLFAALRNNGLPATTSTVLTTGDTNWLDGDNTGTAGHFEVDQTGSGAAYKFVIGSTTDFFQVAPGGGAFISRTFGLIQGVGDTQWSGNLQFTVNPINKNQIIIGSNQGRIFGTTNQGISWSVIGNPGALDGSVATAMAFGAPSQAGPTGALNDLLYVGTKQGHIFVTFDGGGNGGDNWVDISAGLDGSPVTSIVTNPNRGTYEAYATTLDGHVYWMPDASEAQTGTATWTDITGDLASATSAAFGNTDLTQDRFTAYGTGSNGKAASPVLNTMAADWRYLIGDDSPIPVLYVGGTGGVYRSFDRGQTWSVFPSMTTDNALVDGGLLPNTTVTSLTLSLGPVDVNTGHAQATDVITGTPQGESILLATTYGRGMFAIRVAPVIIPEPVTDYDHGDDTGSSDQDLNTSSTTLTFTGSSEATAFGNKVFLTLKDTTTGQIVNGYDGVNDATKTVLTTDTGDFSISIPQGFYANDGSDDGLHVLAIYATDQTGLVSQPVLFNYTLDTTPPAPPTIIGFTNDTGASSTDGITNDTLPTIKGTAVPGGTVELKLNNNLLSTPSAIVADANGTWSYTFDTALPQGTNVIEAAQVDVAGNASVGTNPTLSITVDTDPPLPPGTPVLLASDDTGRSTSDGITSVTRPHFSGTGTANLTFSVLVDGTVVQTGTADSTGLYAFQLNTPLAAGATHTVTVTQTDVAGNVSGASGTKTVVIDVAAPGTPAAPAIIAADDQGSSSSDGVTNVDAPHFAGTAEANAIISVVVDGNAVSFASPVIASSTGAYTFQLPTSFSQGTHTVRVRQTDVAGNTSAAFSAVETVVIDTAPPAVTAEALSGAKNQLFSGTVATFTDVNPAGQATIDWGDGNTSAGTIVSAGGGVMDVNGANTFARSGVFNFNVTVVDQAGNTSVATGTVNVQAGTVSASGGLTINATEATSTGPVTVATFTDPSGAEITNSYVAGINWGDGTGTDTNATISYDGASGVFSVVGTHTYGEDGNYTITVSLTHAGASQAPVTVTSAAVVVNQPVTLAPESFTTAGGEAFSGEVATFTEPGSSPQASDFAATIDWGDGTTGLASSIVVDSSNPHLFHVFAAKTYSETGTYTVRTTVTNKGLLPVSGTATATVANVAPTVVAANVPSVVFAGTSATFVFSATDPSNADTQAGFTYLIDWGDGSTPTTVAATAGNGSGVTLTKTYAAAGSVTVRVTATDKEGLASAPFTQQLAISPVPTVSSVVVNGSPATGGGVTPYVDTVTFTLSAGGSPLPTVTQANLTLLRNGREAITLPANSLAYANGTGTVNLSGLSLPDGDYELQIAIPNGPTRAVDFSRLAGDFNGDGVVDKKDVTLVSNAVRGGTPLAGADFNGNGTVDKADLAFEKKLSGHRLAKTVSTVKFNPASKSAKLPNVSFKVKVGTDITAQDIVIKNPSSTQEIDISNLSFTANGQFSFAIVGQPLGSTSAVIPAGGEIHLRVYLQPVTAGTFTSFLIFNANYPGGVVKTLSSSGTAKIS